MADNVQQFYFSPGALREEAEKRHFLKNEIEQWWKKDLHIESVPDFLSGSGDPFAATGRHARSTRYEDFVILGMAKQAGFSDVRWLTYVADIMNSNSSYKRSLAMPGMVKNGRGRNGGVNSLPRQLVSSWEGCIGKPIENIQMPKGGKLIDWHANRQNRMMPDVSAYDMSQWLKKFRGGAKEYYQFYLSMFLAHGVLFEDYHGGESAGNDQLDGFTDTVFVPAWQKLYDKFGIRPLITQLPWEVAFKYYPEDNADWRQHGIIPEELLSFL